MVSELEFLSLSFFFFNQVFIVLFYFKGFLQLKSLKIYFLIFYGD